MHKDTVPDAGSAAAGQGLLGGIGAFQINDGVARANHFGVQVGVSDITGAEVALVFVLFVYPAGYDFTLGQRLKIIGGKLPAGVKRSVASFAELVVFRGVNPHKADTTGADFKAVAVYGNCRRGG